MRSIFKDHAGLVISLVAAFTIVAKIWTVAHGDPSTVVSLVSNSGAVTSVLGATVAGLPVIGAVPLLLVTGLLPEAIREGDQKKGPIVGTGVAVLVGFATAPSVLFALFSFWLVSTLLVSLTALGVRKRWGKRSPRWVRWILGGSDFPQALSAIVILAVLAISAWAVTLAYDRPWFPPEDITVEGETRTGFVVDEGDDVLTVLWNSDRSVERISADSVDSRTLCRLRSNLAGRSMLSRLIWDEAHYPTCGLRDGAPSDEPSHSGNPTETPTNEQTRSPSAEPSPTESGTPSPTVDPSASVDPTPSASSK